MSSFSPLAMLARLQARAAAQLEGADGFPATSTARSIGALGERAYEALSLRARGAPYDVPPVVAAIAVGGATLGGSYKTPLAIACARSLRAAGVAVVFVGHAYGAKPRGARRVVESDAVDVVGDEAILAQRELAPIDVPVVVAEDRRDAIALAATLGDVLVIDGTMHVAGAKVLRVLSVAAEQPWGSGRLFPFGDLRASPSTLLGAADTIARVSSSTSAPGAAACVQMKFASELRGLRLGLFTAIARPDRIVRALRDRGVSPAVLVRAPDHRGDALIAKARQVSAKMSIDAWLTTSKCAVSLGEQWIGAPRHTLTLDLALSPTFEERLRVFRDGP